MGDGQLWMSDNAEEGSGRVYLERDDADEHPSGEEDEGLDEPDDAPHCNICATSVPSAEY